MKLLKTFSNQEFVIDDDEVRIIIEIKNKDKKAFLELRCGAFVDTAAIESITDIPLRAFSASGYPLSRDGKSFMRDGQRVYVEDLDSIQYLPDPKYKKIYQEHLKLNGK